MDQGGSVRNTNQSNDLLAFCNYITQGDIGPPGTGITTGPADVIVTANIEESESIETDLNIEFLENCCSSQGEPLCEKHFQDEVCSCRHTEDIPGDEVNVSEQEITQLDFKESLSENSSDRGDALSHDNICKTIQDIASDQEIVKAFIPDIEMSQNTLLETALSLSKITPSTASAVEEYIPVELDHQQNGYNPQAWPMVTISNGGINSTMPSESSLVYPNSRHGYTASYVDQTEIRPYPDMSLDNTYMPDTLPSNLYQNQQHYIQPQGQAIIGDQLNQLLQNTQLPLQDFQTHLRPGSLPASAIQKLPSISSNCNKMNSYHQNSHFNTITVPISHTQNSNMPSSPSYKTSYNLNSKNALSADVCGNRDIQNIGESGEDSVVEDRSGEKKLTTTPIPSDAEKMSSNSSVSSGSLGESPSPRDLETEQCLKDAIMVTETALARRQATRDLSNYGNGSCHQAKDLHERRINGSVHDLNSSKGLLNGEEVLNPLPVAESVVVVDNGSIEINHVELAAGKEDSTAEMDSNAQGTNHEETVANGGPIRSISLWPGKGACDDEVHGSKSKQLRVTETASSWSVMREERRKHKLQKKWRKLKQQNDQNSFSNSGNKHTLDVDFYNGNRKHPLHKPRHHHRSKHYRNNEDPLTYSNTSDQDKMSCGKNHLGKKTHPLPNASSALIPKVTADLTKNSTLPRTKLVVSPKPTTEKVKHHSRKEKSSAKHRYLPLHSTKSEQSGLNSANTANQKSNKKSNANSALKSTGTVTIASPRLATGASSNTDLSSVEVRRWQTVTAVQGPKLPPMLSERDRIPKRGRPSKKMSELNLKLKSEASAKAEATEKEKKATPAAGSTSTPGAVSIYTINKEGNIEELDVKPKENRRSKERAEAFQNLLTEISKKTTNEKKTSGAKHIMGTFKAVGVRTRKQTSINDSDDKKRKSRGTSKVFGVDPPPVNRLPSPKSENHDQDGVFTFSELAKQYNISSSIVFRAMEQSQRNSMTRKHTKKLKDTNSQNSTKPSSKPNSTRSPASNSLATSLPNDRNKDSATLKKSTPSSSSGSLPVKSKRNSNVSNDPSSDLDIQALYSNSVIKPVSLSSDRSVGNEDEIVKRKKKKKKHKKDKEDGKKKKNKDKKKKSKRKDKYLKELSDSVFAVDSTSPSASKESNLVTSSCFASRHVHADALNSLSSERSQFKNVAAQMNASNPALVHSGVEKTPKLVNSSHTSSSITTRAVSTSSLSGCEEAYDGGDSSSDADVCMKKKVQTKVKLSDKSPRTIAETKVTPSVFGSGISSIMPSFQGIKEHGGLLQFSEHMHSIGVNLSRGKKHKHKRKKIVGRTKSASDPKFLSQVEELIKHLESIRLCTNMSFNTTAFLGKSTNVFAANFQPKSCTSHSANDDSLSYRDPAKPRSKQKRRNLFNMAASTSYNGVASNSGVVASDTSDVSIFCRSEFFRNHHYIKPFTGACSTISGKSPMLLPAQKKLPRTFSHVTTTPSAKPSRFASVYGGSTFLQSNFETETAKEQTLSQTKQKPDIKSGNLNALRRRAPKRKRGWPRGKLRGPRCKKPSMDVDDGASDSDAIDESNKQTSSQRQQANAKNQKVDQKTAYSPDKSHKSNSTAPHGSSSSKLGKRQKRKYTDADLQSASVQEQSKKAAAEPNVPVNSELVHHITAAITAKFTSSTEVCSDTVAKAVNSAVANFFQEYRGGNDASNLTLTNSSASVDNSKKIESTKFNANTVLANNIKHDPPIKRPRGRPPKHPKQVVPVDSVKQNKVVKKATSKKLGSSGQKVSPTNSTPPVGEPKKRGPGRPRKHSLESSASSPAGKKIAAFHPTTEHLTLPQSASLFSSSRRASALYSPRARLQSKQSTTVSCRKMNRSSATSPSCEEEDNCELPVVTSSRGISNGGVISNHKAKIAVGALLSGKALKHHAKSPSWLAALDTCDPGLYDGTEIDAHISEAIDTTILAACGASETDGVCDDVQLSNSLDSSQKGIGKRSLESVVAKLKSKQTLTPYDRNVVSNSTRLNKQISTSSLEEGNGEHADVRHDASSEPVPKSNNFPFSETTENISSFSSSPSSQQNPNNQDKEDGRIVASLNHEGKPAKRFERVGLFSAALKAGSCDDYNIDEDDDYTTFHDSLATMPDALYENQTNFQLPYKIWKMYHDQELKPTQDLATNYVKIDKNVYADTQPILQQEQLICSCSLADKPDTSGCGMNCANRLTRCECSPESCPCGSRCSNRAIQERRWFPNVERFSTETKGWGIKAKSSIPEGQFILEYVGEVVTAQEFSHRATELYNAHYNQYFMQLGTDKVIDGYHMANEGRFVNHSCEPNCEIQKWTSEGELRLCLFAKRPINEGEELTYDYDVYNTEFGRQQTCRCQTSVCRGVFGRRTQSVTSNNSSRQVMNKLKDQKKIKAREADEQLFTTICSNNMQQTPTEEKKFIQKYRVFLFRNLTQVKQQDERTKLHTNNQANLIDDNNSPEMNKIDLNLLYETIKSIFSEVMTCKDESGVSIAIPFYKLLTKQNNPGHYDHSNDPVDLSYVEDKIVTNQYETLENFSMDLLHAFRNAEKYHGKKTMLAKDVGKLRRIFTAARNAAAGKLGEVEVRHEDKESEERILELEDRRRNGDYIRCICGIYKDEGMMIQCEKCYVWQHCDCMQVSPDDYDEGTPYLCEECDGREVPKEVKVVPQPPSAAPGHTYYLTLLKDNTLVRQGDCARLIHDHCLRQRSSDNPPVRTSYRLQSHSTPDRMDFFRIKKLWTDDNGDKFAYGQHFVRPQDTKHSDSRLFFNNELLLSPFHEIVPLEAVVSLCCVMDLATYRKGLPKGFKECDVYICQHRVDLSFRIVNKVIKNRYPIYTKPHVFDAHPVKLTTVRDFQVPEQYRKTQCRRTQWFKSIDGNAKSGEDESSSGEESDIADYPSEGEESTGVEMMARDSDGESLALGSKRNVKERRLDGILSKLRNSASTREGTMISESS